MTEERVIVENSTWLIATGETNRANIAARLGITPHSLEVVWRRAAAKGNDYAAACIADTRTEKRGWAQW